MGGRHWRSAYLIIIGSVLLKSFTWLLTLRNQIFRELLDVFFVSTVWRCFLLLFERVHRIAILLSQIVKLVTLNRTRKTWHPTGDWHVRQSVNGSLGRLSAGRTWQVVFLTRVLWPTSSFPYRWSPCTWTPLLPFPWLPYSAHIQQLHQHLQHILSSHYHNMVLIYSNMSFRK